LFLQDGEELDNKEQIKKPLFQHFNKLKNNLKIFLKIKVDFNGKTDLFNNQLKTNIK